MASSTSRPTMTAFGGPTPREPPRTTATAAKPDPRRRTLPTSRTARIASCTTAALALVCIVLSIFQPTFTTAQTGSRVGPLVDEAGLVPQWSQNLALGLLLAWMASLIVFLTRQTLSRRALVGVIWIASGFVAGFATMVVVQGWETSYFDRFDSFLDGPGVLLLWAAWVLTPASVVPSGAWVMWASIRDRRSGAPGPAPLPDPR